jgi:predicted transcriptional regulator YdeE
VLSGVEVIELSSSRFVGYHLVTPSSFHPEEIHGEWAIGPLFEKMRTAVVRMGLETPENFFGLSRPADDLVPPHMIWYFAGCASTAVDIGDLETLSFSGGHYFSVTVTGPASAIDDAIREIYGTLFPSTGWKERDGLHVEIYPSTFRPHEASSQMKILIPIESPMA